MGKTSSRTFGLLYLAPEVFRGGPATPASDMYAMGIVVYEVLSKALITAWHEGDTEVGLGYITHGLFFFFFSLLFILVLALTVRWLLFPCRG